MPELESALSSNNQRRILKELQINYLPEYHTVTFNLRKLKSYPISMKVHTEMVLELIY